MEKKEKIEKKDSMRILMLGNSFTFYNDMPQMLAELTGAEVTAHTRGGAYLSEHLNPETELGAKTLPALAKDQWDYVILQEQSCNPVTDKQSFMNSAELLCEKIHEAGAVPVLYATWAYQKGGEELDRLGISYDVMSALLATAYREAAEQGDALLAQVGSRFFKLADQKNLYAEDGKHPSEEGSRLAAEVIADVIISDWKKREKGAEQKDVQEKSGEGDRQLRLLYLYQTLLAYSDENHHLTTNGIRDIMQKEHGITMHRTTVDSDIKLLDKAGYPIQERRGRSKEYFLETGKLNLPELKILIDAVESSRFITQKRSEELVEKLISMTSVNNAEALKHSIYPTGRVKTGNEKGYYIVSEIYEAIRKGKRISFQYTDYNVRKRLFVRGGDEAYYFVSPYSLIWNGDFYYLVGYYHNKERMGTFRVDRILNGPKCLEEDALPKPPGFDISRYTREVFRMFDTEEVRKVTLLCENDVMKGMIDKFGMDFPVTIPDQDHFQAEVDVCASPTFFGWVFQWGGKVRITGPEEVCLAYREHARKALE